MRDIDVDSITGLPSAEVSRKLKVEGYNELALSEKRGIVSITFGVFKEPIFLLLVASGSLYFLLGDATEGIVLFELSTVSNMLKKVSGSVSAKGCKRQRRRS